MRSLHFLIFVFFIVNLVGQDLKKHQWKDRLLLVFVDDKNNATLKNQMNLLANDKKGLLERKLVIYNFTKNEFKMGFQSDWFPFKNKKITHLKKTNSFEVLLIGLDGELKYRQTKLISLKKISSLIDSMPMRIRELKN
ncbi:DUF4174 domain-containing protein [Polaribacter sp. WD7]|uniref:DUF4174 domain-containing protein n=1 Tax=Polaribacter sp. WD7 TaxID=2269061 RepID=UPI000DF3FE62|nr:DUF4174 domain-containing protein [Polaribacter sp. WD7]RCS26601.1 DUF4174 domain-containing protein [Polaribacter sp. WD7]